MRHTIKISMMIAGAAMVAAAGAGTVLVLTDSGRSEPAAARPVATAPALPTFSIPASLGRCDQLAGLPTTEVVEVGLCDDNGPADTILMSATLDCADGRQLHWNDYGWGFSDGQWQAHQRADGQLVPPDDAMSC